MGAILLIQDDTSVQRAISRPLELAGHRVVVLTEPLLALDLLGYTNIHFDLIIAEVASFRYAHQQNTLGLLHRKADAVGSKVLTCTTHGELRINGRYSDLPNPLLTRRFLCLVNSIVNPDALSISEPLDIPVPEVCGYYDSGK